ncbi:OsmC family protein [Marivita sp.]|uniref:OsmC family protein n=1 Tax=Marivita sp. TaxID=2003365 RepID=UPI003B52B210
MDRNTHARQAQLRAQAIYLERPESAQTVHRGSAMVRDGLTCTYEQDGHRVVLDMPHAIGGSDDGPPPGFYARAGICGCLAIGIKMTAAREKLHLDTVTVRIEQDWDNRGVLGMEGANPVASDTRICIDIASPASEDAISDMVARALNSDPWFLAYRDAQPVHTAVSVGADVV